MIHNLLRFTSLFAVATMVQAQGPWFLKTRDTSLTLMVNANQPAIRSLSSADGAPEWVKKPVPVLLSDHVFIQGTLQPVHWKFKRGQRGPAEGQVVLQFISEEPKLEALSIWES